MKVPKMAQPGTWDGDAQDVRGRARQSWLFRVPLLAVAALVAAGCPRRPIEPVPPGAGAQRVTSARLDRLVVGVAAGGSAKARKALFDGAATALRGVDLRVRDLGAATDYDAGADAYAGARGADGVDYLVVTWAEARETDTFGNFHLYEARTRGKVLDPADGALVTTKSVTASGERELDPGKAERSALGAAGARLGGALTAELVKRVEREGQTLRLVVGGVRSTEELDRIKAHLQASPGVVDATCVSWSKATGAARMLVKIRTETKPNLAAYLETVPGISIEVTDLRQRDVSGRTFDER